MRSSRADCFSASPPLNSRHTRRRTLRGLVQIFGMPIPVQRRC